MFTAVRRLLLCGLLLVPAGLASADEPFPHYDTYLEGVAGVDDDALGGSGAAVLPLWYDQSSLLFADLRGVSDSDDRTGANLGVGFRHLTAADWIIGGYGFYDRLHLAGDAAINQGVLGIELMNVDWEFRVNGYLPESFERYVGILSTNSHHEPASLTVHGPTDAVIDYIKVTQRTRHQVEGIYAGADFELGYMLREWNAGAIELRGYIGGFYFDRNGSSYKTHKPFLFPPADEAVYQSRFEAITGPRLRAELRIYDLPSLGPQSRLVATGQYQWDQVRGSQGLVCIGVRVAFGNHSTPKLSRIRRRMLDTIPRQSAVIERGHWTDTSTFSFVPATNAAELEPPTTIITFRPNDPTLSHLR